MAWPTFCNHFISNLLKVIHYIGLFIFPDDGKGLAMICFWEDRHSAQEDLNVMSGRLANKIFLLELINVAYCITVLAAHMREYMLSDSSLIAFDEHEDLDILHATNFSYINHVEKTMVKISLLCGFFAQFSRQGSKSSYGAFGS